jgi:hypothetical protein
MHYLPLPPRRYSWYWFLLEAESIPGVTVRLEGLSQSKIPITPSRIKPTAFNTAPQLTAPLRTHNIKIKTAHDEVDLIHLLQHMVQWQFIVNTAMNLLILYMVVNFYSWTTVLTVQEAPIPWSWPHYQAHHITNSKILLLEFYYYM